jgi:hypothetical protein
MMDDFELRHQLFDEQSAMVLSQDFESPPQQEAQQ